jgi:endonuclease/exonuclease/phosphatase family metal-dependent hydrolase
MNIFISKPFWIKFIYGIFILNAVVYLVACLTPYIHPKYFYPLTFLAIGFPLLVISMVCWLLYFLFFNRKKTLWVLIIILCGFKNINAVFSYHLATRNLPVKSDKHFRVLTWNVKNFIVQEVKRDTAGSPYREIMKFIEKSEADIICIQDFEQSDSSIFLHPASYIKDSLHYPFAYFSKDIDTTTIWGHSIYGTCIFSKYPFINTNSIQYNGKHFTESLGFADVLVNNKNIRVFNTHLRSMYTSIDTTKPREQFKYVVEDTNLVFHSSKFDKIKHFDTSHINQVEMIRRVMDTTKIPFIFCADLNSVPSSFVYHQLSKSLTDAFTAKGSGWQGTYSGKIPFLRIDVVLMSNELKCNNYYSPRLKLSDHYPIITDISFR